MATAGLSRENGERCWPVSAARTGAFPLPCPRPYADEWNLGAEMPLPFSTLASIQLFRRDEKDRIAAINTGVPPGVLPGNNSRSRPRWQQ